MRRFGMITAMALLVSVSASSTAAGQEQRTGEPAASEATTWDLTELFPTVEDWDMARQDVLARLSDIEAQKGTLGETAHSLLDAARLISDTRRAASRVSVYSGLAADEDVRVSEKQERRQLARSMWSRFSSRMTSTVIRRESSCWRCSTGAIPSTTSRLIPPC